MKHVQFHTQIRGIKFDCVLAGDTDDKIVSDLRVYAAGKIPHIPFTDEDDKIREELTPNEKDPKSWTNPEFFQVVVEGYNKMQEDAWEKLSDAKKKGKDAPTPLLIPTTATEFIDVAVKAGIAVIEP